jgi:hypothetical protein
MGLEWYADFNKFQPIGYSFNRLNELQDEQLNPKLLQIKQYLNFLIKTVKDS